jgi:hypothetical protein
MTTFKAIGNINLYLAILCGVEGGVGGNVTLSGVGGNVTPSGVEGWHLLAVIQII